MTDVAVAATLYGPEDLRMVTQPLGALADGMVRIKFGAAGICGSDMHYFRHARTGNFIVTSPLVLGHEIAGTVAEINARGTRLKIGDHVAVNPSHWCGHCARCREGRANLCENIYFHGFGLQDAAYAGWLRQLLRCHPRTVRGGAPAAVRLALDRSQSIKVVLEA